MAGSAAAYHSQEAAYETHHSRTQSGSAAVCPVAQISAACRIPALAWRLSARRAVL